MKVVVDVNETVYEHYKDLCQCQNREDLSIVIRAIGEGVPLPKKHGRLVDADLLESNAWDLTRYMDLDYGTLSNMLDKIPTIIEAEGE